MKRLLLRALGALAALLVLALASARAVSAHRESSAHDVTLVDVVIPDDPGSIAEGERLYVSRGCGGADCHARDGGGHVTLSDGALGTIVATNLTTRARGFAGRDWDRAVRHGMRADGRSLVMMPSQDFVAMPDRELALIAAYVRSLPSVERELPATELGLLARVLDVAGAFTLFPAHVIDHQAVAAPDPEPGRSAEHGAYLARACTGCHGARLSGGAIPGAPASLGMPRNLTFHETGLSGWSEADFVRAMREGRTPDGAVLSAAQMPWPDLGRMSDDELGAIYLYLQSLPHLPEGSR